MSKQLKAVIIAFAALLLVGGLAAALLFQPAPTKKTDASSAIFLAQRPLSELASLAVTNEAGSYRILQEGGGFLLEGIPTELLNADYIQMAVEEATTVAALSVVEQSPADLAPYGLEHPAAQVEITYSDGTVLALTFGAVEPIADARYFTVRGKSTVYLMDRARTIRFTMPITDYIQYLITPERTLPSPLSVVKNATFTGSALPQTIAVTEVRADHPEEMLAASSFGVATHLVNGIHELDQTAGAEVFGSLLGLVRETVVDYNCTPAALAAYGFDAPYLQILLEIQNGADAPRESITLRVVKKEDGTLLCTKNEDGVVYTIRDVAFTTVSYEKLVMRWFLTPFITEVAELTVASPTGSHTFVLGGEGDNKKLTATCDKLLLDTALFRDYYRLLVSAANDSTPLAAAPATLGTPLLTVTFRYRNAAKPEDTLRCYAAGTRRVWVEVNGITEFTMHDTYVEKLLAATTELLAGRPISTEW